MTHADDTFAPPASTEAELAAARAEIGRLGEDLLQAHADADVQRFERKRLEGVLRAVRAWRTSRGNTGSAYFAALDTILADEGGAVKPTAPVEPAPATPVEGVKPAAAAPATTPASSPAAATKPEWCSRCQTIHSAEKHTRPQPIPNRSEE